MSFVRCWRRIGPGAALVVTLVTGCADSGPTGSRPLPPPDADAHNAEVPLAWLRLTMELTRDEGLFPPPAARAYGYVGVTLWEAVAPGVPGGRSLAGQLNEFGGVAPAADLHWPAVANAALAEISRRFYTSESSRMAIDALEDDFQGRFQDQVLATLLEPSAAHGRSVADEVWAWSLGDRYAEMNNCPYTPPEGAGRWSPTPPGFEGAVQPCWGQLRPFYLSAPSACAAGPHAPYSEDPESEFYGEALEVYETVNTVTEEERTIAFFWADLAGESATPAGHSLSIAAQALEQIPASMALAAETFARVGIGEADAFIASWATKYHYGLMRPVTYIHRMMDTEWMSILETPPFPAFTSGHSNDVGAASTIMTAMLGDGFAFVDHTNDDRGFAPRAFGSFYEAAEESAVSRLYGGIHYRMDIERGLEQGQCVGHAVNGMHFRDGS